MAFKQPRLRALAAALASLAVLAETSGAWAQDDPEGERATPALPTVVISGSKRDQRLDSLNGAASVAERTELEDAQAASTLDLARVFPDLTLSYSGSQLFPIVTLRGVTSAQDFYNPALTVYVDGVPQLPVAAIQSKASEPRWFWLVAASPSNSSATVARVLGSRRAPSRSSTSALGSSMPAE